MSCNTLNSVTGNDLQQGRTKKGWTQEEAAHRLGVSQPYLSLLENGSRRVPEKLAHKVSSLFELSPTRLPMKEKWHSVEEKNNDENEFLAADLAALGYPGFAYLKSARKRNPAEVLFAALSAKNLEPRVTEALPWLLMTYADLDWQWLMRAAKVNDLQNKLGFLTNVARRLAQNQRRRDVVTVLRDKESLLERSRLVREETLCHESLTQAERNWLKSNRSKEAKHWHLLTDLSPKHLSHAI